MLLRAVSSRMFCCRNCSFEFRDQLSPGAGELPRAPGQEAVRDGADQAHAEHRDGGGSHGQRQRGRRESLVGEAQHRIGHDLNRAHRGEMMRDDRKRQQHGGGDGAAPCRWRRTAISSATAASTTPSTIDASDQIGAPTDIAGHLQRPHAEVVHAGDAGADDRAADRRRPTRPARSMATRKPGDGDDHRDDERGHGQADVVGHRHARLVGEHGDEMRRPDAAAGGGAGEQKPRVTRRARARAARARWNRLTATRLASRQTKPANTTSRQSCSPVRHENTRNIEPPIFRFSRKT